MNVYGFIDDMFQVRISGESINLHFYRNTIPDTIAITSYEWGN